MLIATQLIFKFQNVYSMMLGGNVFLISINIGLCTTKPRNLAFCTTLQLSDLYMCCCDYFFIIFVILDDFYPLSDK